MRSSRSLYIHLPLLGALLMGCGGPPGGNHTNTPQPATGLLIINVGFSAGAATTCTGSETVTVTPIPPVGTTGRTTATSQPVSFGGTGQRIDDRHQGCQATVTLPGMAVGSWRISDGAAACPATITAGNATTVNIWEHVCGA